jgi:hypothetical protein
MQCIESVLRGMGAKKGRVVSHRQVALFTMTLLTECKADTRYSARDIAGDM